jgi:hypothetical protein
MAQPKPDDNYKDAYQGLVRTLEEEAAAIEKLVADEDSSCPARELRRERAATLRWVIALADNLGAVDVVSSTQTDSGEGKVTMADEYTVAAKGVEG